MLKLRIVTVAVVLPLFLAAIFLLPNSWWSLALVAPLLVAGHEWSRLAGFGRNVEALFLLALLAGCWLLWMAASLAATRPANASAAIDRTFYVMNVAFWCVVAPCWLWLKLAVRDPVALAAAGLVVLLPAWLALARLQNDAPLLLLLLGVIWIADSAAYFTGRALGRRKLAPAISPGKTWEGVGGAFAAVTVYALALHFSLLAARDLPAVISGFVVMTVLSIVGDLFESWLKRNAGVKDSGGIFPGHGGMLDRIDGITAALPLAALIFIQP
ncbi:MAG: phosphatidate cytidylyltransferase [Betaproteobacteria bacterium]|nr:phosphatidate cytidylyltransferase [Betaproteobacteria bacterium]